VAARASRTPPWHGGILTLGQTLGLETIAEGIETAEQLVALRELGCQLGQGYYFARPLGPAAVDALLERHYPRAHTPTTAAHEPML
jgi:EAL domain-containing protein (putative c-di-GMP-specific phosphodiesterase class I)